MAIRVPEVDGSRGADRGVGAAREGATNGRRLVGAGRCRFGRWAAQVQWRDMGARETKKKISKTTRGAASKGEGGQGGGAMMRSSRSPEPRGEEPAVVQKCISCHEKPVMNGKSLAWLRWERQRGCVGGGRHGR